MVWATTTHVGCAVVDCRGRPGFVYDTAIVCNYGPSGNLIGARPYTAGSAQDCRPAVVKPTPTTRPTESLGTHHHHPHSKGNRPPQRHPPHGNSRQPYWIYPQWGW
ncbi:unnamed protein product [Dicrocoelium dendriticum]|nr:unnamed protein product [Dicrocoelium dendriticum]